MTDDKPTHKCAACGAYWKFWAKGQTGFYCDTWNLRSPKSCAQCESDRESLKELKSKVAQGFGLLDVRQQIRHASKEQ